jgi:uncharacterized protein (UPF0147 family)
MFKNLNNNKSTKKNKKPFITILYQNNIMTMRQTKEMRKRDNQEKLLKSMNLIESILKNHTVPKSIKNSMKEILSTLRDERNGEISVRVANAISLLENITQNPHIQSHIRTNIWQLISTLESIKE